MVYPEPCQELKRRLHPSYGWDYPLRIFINPLFFSLFFWGGVAHLTMQADREDGAIFHLSGPDRALTEQENMRQLHPWNSNRAPRRGPASCQPEYTFAPSILSTAPNKNLGSLCRAIFRDHRRAHQEIEHAIRNPQRVGCNTNCTKPARRELAVKATICIPTSRRVPMVVNP